MYTTDGTCPYCGHDAFEGVDRPRGDDWVNKCVSCEQFNIYLTDVRETHELSNPLDEGSPWL